MLHVKQLTDAVFIEHVSPEFLKVKQAVTAQCHSTAGLTAGDPYVGLHLYTFGKEEN